MEHKFPLGSCHLENGTTFSEFPFILENVHWIEPKSRVHLYPNRIFRNFLANGKRSTSPTKTDK